ncbi:hypothetical protein NBRC10512_004209 [Rhodotorula toruloides]|uniref:RHTO0S25e01530g1_1 n=2 Tax=Rhodotorula toruloides TaxID=5286 RepID=A0A061BMW2_RHOTO|nr:uncharacterized protein RHTO_05556 [Rhodotorula toruloides NP11]EMS18809.1 hypothetical protein RHTO_05556 [Rhodotorula toruloides NP11]CDR49334.1 RHTO0S25e01530g1_1 [Rhodotorula toruloides]
MPGPGDLTPQATPPPPHSIPPTTHARQPHPMSRSAAAAEDDSAMGFAEDVGSAASSVSSPGDDLPMRNEGGAEDERMLTEGEDTAAPGPSSSRLPPSVPASSAYAPTSPTKRATRSSNAAGPSSRNGPRSSKRERAAQMFASGEGEFERERAVIEGSRRGGRGGGGGEDGEGRSAEDNIMQKLLDKDYAGRLNFDPFLQQLQALRHSKESTATGPSAPAGAPASPSTQATPLPPPVLSTTEDGPSASPVAPAA